MTSIFWSLYRSAKASIQHLKAAGLRQRVVMSQNMMPFFGKSGTPLMELATSSFFSSNNMASALFCPDTTKARPQRRKGAGNVSGGPVRDVCLMLRRREGGELRYVNMQHYRRLQAQFRNTLALPMVTRSSFAAKLLTEFDITLKTKHLTSKYHSIILENPVRTEIPHMCLVSFSKLCALMLT